MSSPTTRAQVKRQTGHGSVLAGQHWSGRCDPFDLVAEELATPEENQPMRMQDTRREVKLLSCRLQQQQLPESSLVRQLFMLRRASHAVPPQQMKVATPPDRCFACQSSHEHGSSRGGYSGCLG